MRQIGLPAQRQSHDAALDGGRPMDAVGIAHEFAAKQAQLLIREPATASDPTLAVKIPARNAEGRGVGGVELVCDPRRQAG